MGLRVPAVVIASANDAELRAVARRLYDEAQAAAPQIRLDAELFIARALAAIAEHADSIASLESLHAADLFLAQAAVAGDQAAFVLVDRRMCEQIASVVRAINESQSFADDLESLLRAHIFSPRETRGPRLASYSGSGPLDGWLRVTTTREAVRTRRARAAQGSASGDDVENLPATVVPGLEFLEAAYREHVRVAFRAAIRALDERQQSLIRLHYGEGVGVERLGHMYRVHFSTISRWLASARDRLFEETRTAIRARLGVDNAAFDEIMDLVQSRLDVTISLFVRADS